MNCKCILCGREYIYTRGHGHTLSKCNSCMANTRRFEGKRKIIEYLGGKCSVCGYNKCAGALQAHHVSGTKEFNLSGNHGRSWKVLQPELDKCILLCGNCHLERHHGCDRYKCGGIV